MSDIFSLPVETRDPQKNKGTGTRVSRKLRAADRVPAIVYGHKQEPLPVSIHRDDVWRLIKQAARLAELKHGTNSEMVLVRDIQWDHLGKEVLHLDFARVSAGEEVRTEVKFEFHGTAPGIAAGGALEVLVHALPVLCRADAIPSSLRIEIGGVNLGDAIHVKDLVLPDGIKADVDPDLLILHVVTRGVAAEEPTEGEAGPSEPEVIGRKAEEKEED